MGYTTEFEGSFRLSRELNDEEARWLDDLMHGELPGIRGYSCDWELNDDLRSITWNGMEKFYDYVEWMQHIVDSLKSEFDVDVTGTVYYWGESHDDHGVLKVVDGKVLQIDDSEHFQSLEEENAMLKAEVQHYKMLITEMNEQRLKMMDEQSEK
jgi:hypothetical protein